MTSKLLIVVCSLFLIACQGDKTEYLFLNKEQLKPLGIVLNDNGVFYKNLNPNWEQDNARFQGLAFYSTKEAYLNTRHFHKNETFPASNWSDEVLDQQAFTQNDFYPVLIGNTHGDYSLDKADLPKDLKMLPIAICMSQAKIGNRTDTLLIWLLPTERLQKSLPNNIHMTDYLSRKK